jgi:hypothetical protein
VTPDKALQEMPRSSSQNVKPFALRPGAQAITHDSHQYSLPVGLGENVTVTIVSFDHGYYAVRDEAGNEWLNVYMTSLEVAPVRGKPAMR